MSMGCKRMIKRFFAILITTLLSFPAAGSESVVNVKAPEFALDDQHNNHYDIRQDVGKVIVLLASDGDGAAQNKQWVDNIEKRYGKNIIPIIGIADVRKVPRWLRGMVKREFKKTPVGVLLDWKGVVFTSYGLSEYVANIVLIDKKGFVRYIYSGEATPEACQGLFMEIDKLSQN